MAFHEVRFPTELSFGSEGGPERRTEIVALANGFEERNTPWEHARRRYDAGVSMRSPDDVAQLIAFFEARRGQLHAFRWKDWFDYKSCSPRQEVACDDQILGTGDGATRVFQLVKTYFSGGQSYVRQIAKPVPSTVCLAVGGLPLTSGVDFDVDHSNGLVSLANAPEQDATVTAGFEFDVPVRFDTDRIRASAAGFQVGNVPSVPVVEVRV